MKAFFRFLCLVIPVQSSIAAAFAALNNLPALPWEICRLLWYLFPPLSAFCVASLYGFCGLKGGGGLFWAGLLLSPLIILCLRLPLPFSDFFTRIPLILACIPAAFLGEIHGRTCRRRKSKKRNPMDSAANVSLSDEKQGAEPL